MMVQYGFFFDQGRCTGCHTCAVACKNWHGLDPGPLKYLKVYQYEKGVFPNLRLHFQWVPCYHCENPVCIKACPKNAIYKEDKYGAVLIDSQKCDGCRICYEVCPYGAPVFESDDIGAIVQKCDMCINRLDIGEKPICVLSCPSRALDFGNLSELRAIYKYNSNMEDLPKSKITKPSVVFKSHNPKHQLVPYDTEKALELLRRREQFSPLFTSIDDAVNVPEGMVGRDRLVLKHNSKDDLMRYTRSDEG